LKLAATPDRTVALVFFLFFGALFALSLQLGYWDGFAPSSGFAPLWVAVVGIALAAALFFAKNEANDEAATTPDEPGALLRVGQAIVGIVIFLAVTPFLGMVPAGFLLMLGLLLIVLRRPLPASLLTAVISTALVYAVFVAWLNVPLPKGFLGI